LAKYPNRIVMLGQHFEKHSQRSSARLMSTIIKNGGILMNPQLQRAVVPAELFVSQAFPYYDWQIGTACGIPIEECTHVCSFGVSRLSRALPPRGRRSLVGMAGNTMNVNIIGAATIWALAYAQRQDRQFLMPFALLRRRPKGFHSHILG
jgi:hypothetical protein